VPWPQWSPCSVWVLSFRTTPTEPYEAGIEAGCDALARGAWADARACFAAALAVNESPEAYEGLGTAARYQLDSDAAIDAHERGYRAPFTRRPAWLGSRAIVRRWSTAVSVGSDGLP
jgi:hypothetical protein